MKLSENLAQQKEFSSISYYDIDAKRRYCLSQGWDFMEDNNIAFRHLDKGGMPLSLEGNRLFARNLNSHAKSG